MKLGEQTQRKLETTSPCFFGILVDVMLQEDTALVGTS